MQASSDPLSGLYRPNDLKGLYYGPDVVKKHLRSLLPRENSKAFIITGESLAKKTPLIKGLEELLGPNNLASVFSNIKEHAPVAQLDQATEQVLQTKSIDTIISVGGGSPIDSAKAIIFRVHEKTGTWLTHITIPTTLSAAECTTIAGYTNTDGVKTGLNHPRLYPSYILYDPRFGLYTPPRLLLSTGLRALDHAVEIQYHPYATWIPTRLVSLNAISELVRLLRLYKANPGKDEDVITGLFLAAYASLGFLGQNVGGPTPGPTTTMFSHSVGYALGSPYGIPHGITSGMSLGRAVKVVARLSEDNARNIAAVLPYISGEKRSGDDIQDCDTVGDRILELVEDLGLRSSLTEYQVGKDQVDVIAARSLRLVPGKEIEPQDKELFEKVQEMVRLLW